MMYGMERKTDMSLINDMNSYKAKVIFNKLPIAELTQEKLDELEQLAKDEPSGNIKYCLHEHSEDALHEMLNFYTAYSYCQPHYHPDKVETKIILKGELLTIIYDENGEEKQRIIMSPSQGARILHLKEGIIHTDIPLTDCIFWELKTGPFDKERDNVFLDRYPTMMAKEDVRNFVGVSR